MNHQTRVYDSILEMLSNVENPTPLVRLHRVLPYKHTKVYAKLEWYNPFGAVKDRVAANLVRDAEEHGRIHEGIRLVEPTSGNTGMALAMLANAKGYKFTATMSNKVPAEKRASLRMFGTDLVELEDDLCPAPGAPEGAIALAAELGDKEGSFHLNQYKNPANPEAHFLTTGPEVWRQTDGKVTHFVAGLGTCGTITGTGRFLKKQNANVKVLGVHPVEGHDIPGVRSIRQLKQTALFFPNEYDGLVDVHNDEAFELCKRLNQEESIIAGPSSAMALAGAFKLIPDEPGAIAVVMFPDNIFKYASSIRKHLPELFKNAKPEAGPVSSNLANIVEFARGSEDVIEPAEAKALLDAKQVGMLVDVRGVEEHRSERLPDAVNVPLPDLVGGYPVGLPEDHDTPILTVCKVGERSLYGMLILKSMGYHNVKNIKGGLKAWSELGYPTEKGAAG
ncbi:MAG TPA: pyridoxal-phosphate dependent enzyme [Polyangiaceae bacterium]|nr:pyridoxal-phosphate dependent enzyme [Polyangiaceae bacterium]